MHDSIPRNIIGLWPGYPLKFPTDPGEPPRPVTGRIRINVPIGDDCDVRAGPDWCLLLPLWLLGSLVMCEDELAEPVVVTMAGTDEARGPAVEASAMLRRALEAAHVEGCVA